jgi:hypothetical protein
VNTARRQEGLEVAGSQPLGGLQCLPEGLQKEDGRLPGPCFSLLSPLQCPLPYLLYFVMAVHRAGSLLTE